MPLDDARDDSFCVVYWGEKATTRGWVKRSEVIPFSQALDVFTAELRRAPTANAYAIRGTLWTEKREYDKAIADLNTAIRLDPNDNGAYATLACIFSTCPNIRFRDIERNLFHTQHVASDQT